MDTLSEYIRLDFRSQEPIYLQIARQVEKLVHGGILEPGHQLPTVRQMAIDLRINFSTVARAYHILDEQKLISTQRGRGTYIWEDSDLDEQAAEPKLTRTNESTSLCIISSRRRFSRGSPWMKSSWLSTRRSLVAKG